MAQREYQAQLAIIGSGLAGFSASVFALGRGLVTAQAGNTGAVAYTTGYLDLLGTTPQQKPGTMLTDPWQGLSDLATGAPDHPLARIPHQAIRKAFSEFTRFLGDCGIHYSSTIEQNVTALTPAGTTKVTCCVPATMQAGVDGLASQSRCLIIDFRGLRGFSGRQVVANLNPRWPGLRCERLVFPDMESGEIYPEVMARALEVPANQEKLAAAIRAVKGDAELVGLPAIMGIYQPDRVLAALENLVGCPLFEIPTMPPSVPGIRLREMFEQVFPTRGLMLIPQQKIRAVDRTGSELVLQMHDNYGPLLIRAEAVILATGRFLSGGLVADREQIHEPLLGLPVRQPASRGEWHRDRYLDWQGHPVNSCGLEVDDDFRPLDHQGAVVDTRLFAAGAILGHQDWIRSRCGAGVAIASAYQAVEAARRYLSGTDSNES